MRNHFLRKLLGFHRHQSGKRQEGKEHRQGREEIPVFLLLSKREENEIQKISFYLNSLCARKQTLFLTFFFYNAQLHEHC